MFDNFSEEQVRKQMKSQTQKCFNSSQLRPWTMTQYCIISATSSGGGRDQKNVFAAVVQTTPALKPLGRGGEVGGTPKFWVEKHIFSS